MEMLHSSLHALAMILQGPVIVLLLLFAALLVVEIGSVLAERLVERRGKKADAANILWELEHTPVEVLQETITKQPLLNRQKKMLLRLLAYRELTPEAGQALAGQLLAEQEQRYRKILLVTDFIVKLAPMLGLMGTLIPLGPGILALGQGDIQTLGDSLLSAFDTTIAGLATGGVAFVLSKIRKLWYQRDMVLLETLTNGLLEAMYHAERQQDSAAA